MTSHLFFTIENGDLVRVFGMVNSQEEKEKVETLVKKAKDIKRVANDLVIVNLSMTGL
jgi:osmotically-inducible protein OsmY